MTKKLRILLLSILSLLLIVPLGAAPVSQAAETDFSVAAKAAISVDFETGKVFYDQDGKTPMGIASITKILGLYMVEQQVKEGKLKWEDPVAISDYAAAISVHPDLSNVPLHKENQYTVKELFDASVIQSANAAIIALGEKIAGSEPKFVDMIREQLKAWGITDATIVNCSGLNNSYLEGNIYPGTAATDENLMSARDVAIVARHLIKDYPDVLEVSKTTSKMFGQNTQSPVEMVNWNWMLPGFVSAKEGVDGLKTGTTDLAGACFVGTMVKDNQRIITVVLNATNHQADPSARFVETGKLMDYTYANWKQEEVTKAGAEVPDHKTLPVKKGKELTATIALKEPVKLWVRTGMNLQDVAIKTTLSENELTAPVAEGDKVGTATVSLKEDTLGYLDNNVIHSTDIVTTQAIEKANFFELAWRGITDFFTNLF